MTRKIINKYGYEVPMAIRAKSAYVGESLKKGDLVEVICDLNGTTKAKKGDRFRIKKMWKNKYATVLEFEGTDLSAASIAFKKVEGI